MLLIVSLKLLLSPVMMISSPDRILTARRTKGYFHGGRFEDPETSKTTNPQPCPALPHKTYNEPSPSQRKLAIRQRGQALIDLVAVDA